jgi:pyruvate dehydrogenase E1 component
MLQRCLLEADPVETREWLDSLDAAHAAHGGERARFLLNRLIERAHRLGVQLDYAANTPYVNTIPLEKQPPFPGDRAIERRIKSLVRWNAVAMVLRANRKYPGIGGHLATFASAATLYEVALNHFLRAPNGDSAGDQVYFQGHAAPGMYARAYMEYRLSAERLHNFRRELEAGGGLSSYPHPWLMPDFWQFPTVSMGLSAINAIYQARFHHYLRDRGLLDTSRSRVWAFLGDGEMDEPESLGAITLASREHLDNLIVVVNCNLQRLDGPVRGNGSIIQELEAAFRGAGWNVIKVLWGDDWDPLLAADADGLLVKRFGEVVDGQYQKYIVAPGSYTRQDFFGAHPKLLKLVEHLSDDQIRRLRRGGHDPAKVYAAYKAAVEYEHGPTVILAKTVKGYGLDDAGEGMNTAHQAKKLSEEQLRKFRDRFDIPIADKDIPDAPFYRPPQESEEIQYLLDRRRALGGPMPRRVVRAQPIEAPPVDLLKEFLAGSNGRAASTTMAFVRMLALLLRDKRIGKLIVPIVPDEARTFGMEGLFRAQGIYAHTGQLYDPVDSHVLLYYREAKEGQILEEGITEAGSMASFSAAGTAYAHHGVNTIPFFLFYSMFGFQRIGDLIWAFGDSRGKGFLLGATAGRTTLAGEGLQHQDGNSHLIASTVPNLRAYDPAFAYEIATLIQHGIREMYEDRKDVFYYMTIYNENYAQPPMPDGCTEGIIRGAYKYKPAEQADGRPRVHLFGSGTILNEALRAQELLADKFSVAADVWSITSYTELQRDAAAVERWNMLHPAGEPRTAHITRLLQEEPYPIVAASDYVKALPQMISPYVPAGLHALGTDGFGRSDGRESLRRFFEVDAESIALAALQQLARRGEVQPSVVQDAMRHVGIDPEKPEPIRS